MSAVVITQAEAQMTTPSVLKRALEAVHRREVGEVGVGRWGGKRVEAATTSC